MQPCHYGGKGRYDANIFIFFQSKKQAEETENLFKHTKLVNSKARGILTPNLKSFQVYQDIFHKEDLHILNLEKKKRIGFSD